MTELGQMKRNMYGHAITKIQIVFKDIFNMEERYSFDALTDEGKMIMNAVDEALRLKYEKEKREKEKCEFKQYLKLKEKYEGHGNNTPEDLKRLHDCQEALKTKTKLEECNEKYPKGSYL